jgi:nicotinamide mononucleotide (NMN) deamidase PncC
LSTGDSDLREIAAAIHSSGRKLVLAVTGGGSGAISALLETPGASRTILEAVVPYSLPALADWIGGKPEQACSEATARAMAMAAFMRVLTLTTEGNVSELVGVGCTASLATDRPKRGPRRIHVGIQAANRTSVYSLALTDERPTRANDEKTAALLLLSLIAEACGVKTAKSPPPDSLRADTESVEQELVALLLGYEKKRDLKPGTSREYYPDEAIPPSPLVFPGAFNPPHTGHQRMADIAERRLGTPLAWEISLTNVDKPPLDFIALRDRIAAIQAMDESRRIALSRAATFREKATLFPGATFVVGVDTMLRIAEPRYYGDDNVRRDAAVAEIARHGCRFLVFGREMEGRFVTLGDLNLPARLRALCDEVPAEEFREDVSSSALRAHLAPGP